MTQIAQHNHDPDKLAQRLKRLSNSWRLIGYGGLLISLTGLGSYRTTGPLALDIFVVSLLVIGSIGLSTLICGQILWRNIYGGSPSVFPDIGDGSI